MICKYFLPLSMFSFFFLDSVLWSTNIFNFGKVQLIYFSFIAYALVSDLQNRPLIQDHEDLLWFSSKNAIVLALSFRSLIHFELFFIHGGWEVEIQLHSFASGYPVVSAAFVEKTVLSSLNSLGTQDYFVLWMILAPCKSSKTNKQAKPLQFCYLNSLNACRGEC